ncbi:MAG: hypothetical protein HOG05_08860 [Bacteroidetes bacterium]|nr:hypothetical protein [Bacteroidota bacterium]MBT5531197.1 hypothetical protein [Cytophagia bacterium]MBT3801250.1 hypothetical protein [Bacteroidota bacterium]MBT3935460.1 hypothetical protein [Bacteroidota bacterium]MBT4729148.1 hypothetical protein [Bacteroidota bacterium]
MQNFTTLFKKLGVVTKFSLMVALFLAIGLTSSAKQYFWVGGTGDWSDHANHWATTTGGLVFHPSVPSQFDTVIFDANSFTASGQSCNVTFESYCALFDSRDVIAGAKFTSNRALHIYGGINISENLTFSQSGNMTVYDGGINIGDALTNNNISFTVSGTVKLNDDGFTVYDGNYVNHSGSFQLLSGDVAIGKHCNVTVRSLTLNAGKLDVADSSTFNGHHMYISGGNVTFGKKVTFYDYGQFYIYNGSLTVGENSSFRQDHHTLDVRVGDFNLGANSTYYRYGGNTYVRDGDFVCDTNTNFKSWSHTQVNNGSFIIGKNSTYRNEGGYNFQIWNGTFVLGENTSYYSRGYTYLYTDSLVWNNSNSIYSTGQIWMKKGDFHLTDGVSFYSSGTLYTEDGSLTVDSAVTATIRGTVRLYDGSIDLHPSANLDWWANLYLFSKSYGEYDINVGGRDIKRLELGGSNYGSVYNLVEDLKASSDGLFLYANKFKSNGYGIDVYHFYSWTGGVVDIDVSGTDTIWVRSQFRMYPSTNTTLNMGNAVINWHGTDHFYLYGGTNLTFNDMIFDADNTGSTVIHFEYYPTIRDITINAKGTQYMELYGTPTIRNFTANYTRNVTANTNISFNSGSWNVTDSFSIQSTPNLRMNLYSYRECKSNSVWL